MAGKSGSLRSHAANYCVTTHSSGTRAGRTHVCITHGDHIISFRKLYELEKTLFFRWGTCSREVSQFDIPSEGEGWDPERVGLTSKEQVPLTLVPWSIVLKSFSFTLSIPGLRSHSNVSCLASSLLFHLCFYDHTALYLYSTSYREEVRIKGPCELQN